MSDYAVKGHYNPVKAVENGWPIRLSKSSFMTYLSCPRKYWWQNVEMEGIRMPANEFMIHGTAVHKSLENLYGSWSGEEDLRPLFDGEEEYVHTAVDNLADLETQRLASWGPDKFMPFEFEVKHEHRIDVEWENEDGTTGSYPVVLVGMIDGLMRHPETGSLVIAELKTGKLGAAKQTKTRKELAYYAHLLDLIGYGETSHFMYLYPECSNEKIVHDLMEKEMKGDIEMWLNDIQGVGYMEPFKKRTKTAFNKSLSKVIQGLATHEWGMKWNDFFCNNYCEFNMSCEEELVGAGWSLNAHTAEQSW